MEAMDRRSALALGAAFLSPAALLPKPANAEMYARHAGTVVSPGVRRVDLGWWPVALPNYRSIAVWDYIVAPGSSRPPEKIRYDTIHHVLDGEVYVTQDKAFWVKTGGLYVSVKDETSGYENRGELDAVIRAIMLKPR